MALLLTADELLAGASATHTVEIPASVLNPAANGDGAAGQVVLRPLTIRDVQRVTKAAREQRILSSILMVQQALVTPALTVENVAGLSAGLVQFLLGHVNRISGLEVEADELENAVRAPMARACFVLAREFGWSPAECSELTVGQVLLYLEMIARDGAGGGEQG